MFWFSGVLLFLSGRVTSAYALAGDKQTVSSESSVNALLNFSSHRGDYNQTDKAAENVTTGSEY